MSEQVSLIVNEAKRKHQEEVEKNRQRLGEKVPKDSILREFPLSKMSLKTEGFTTFAKEFETEEETKRAIDEFTSKLNQELKSNSKIMKIFNEEREKYLVTEENKFPDPSWCETSIAVQICVRKDKLVAKTEMNPEGCGLLTFNFVDVANCTHCQGKGITSLGVCQCKGRGFGFLTPVQKSNFEIDEKTKLPKPFDFKGIACDFVDYVEKACNYFKVPISFYDNEDDSIQFVIDGQEFHLDWKHLSPEEMEKIASAIGLVEIPTQNESLKQVVDESPKLYYLEIRSDQERKQRPLENGWFKSKKYLTTEFVWVQAE